LLSLSPFAADHAFASDHEPSVREGDLTPNGLQTKIFNDALQRGLT
jgi:hypothetical protein